MKDINDTIDRRILVAEEDEEKKEKGEKRKNKNNNKNKNKNKHKKSILRKNFWKKPKKIIHGRSHYCVKKTKELNAESMQSIKLSLQVFFSRGQQWCFAILEADFNTGLPGLGYCRFETDATGTWGETGRNCFMKLRRGLAWESVISQGPLQKLVGRDQEAVSVVHYRKGEEIYSRMPME
ncbi:hypothetical protein ElyMa_004682600 [Elysia marginata]|uniref:Uncharacterized protein n=1 Tax=Elysia marginata TaxID=1093978 RepID=A0AAV4I4V1_9GAST|nr:hypothetical protein ElyMa_004682600 [Elysia marginata]